MVRLPIFLRNPSTVIFYCFALAFFSFFVLSPDGSTSLAVFTLVAFMTFIVRPVYNMHVKAVCYLLLSMLAYWTFGVSYVSAGPLETFPLPVLTALAVLSALLALVAYSDGKLSGSIFAGGSLILLFLAYKDIWSLTTALAIFLSAYVMVHFLSRITGPENFYRNVAAASLSSGLFLFLSGLTSVASGAALALHPLQKLDSVALNAVFLLLASLVFTLLTLLSFEKILERMRLRRFVEGDVVAYGPADGRLKLDGAEPKMPIQLKKTKRK